ncbi:substrate-binding domain-containing protein [Okibacterium fritillariae]|uniref:substrate-binding domain-containing protein n=1 Tax=Okibacterium fritillariae TaxID=123320 RepID=UPI0040557BB4
MTRSTPQPRDRDRAGTTRPRRRGARLLALAAIAGIFALTMPLSAAAAQYQRISGEGSSWAGNAVAQWQADVKSRGVTVDYTPNGSSTGRKSFAQKVNAQFAVSEIPYRGDTADPKDTSYPDFGFSMMPMVAGGTSFMYNLPVNGNRYESLNLSQDAAAKIFTGQITQWNDGAIAADNPGVNLPAAPITVVVRSEGSGATAQFTLWLQRQFPSYYASLCKTTGGCDGAHATSYFPTSNLKNFVAQNGSTGVTKYTESTPYTINYDEYSYSQAVGFPVANLKNAAGFYTVPTDTAVAVALTQAKINTDPASENYLAQDLSAVYAYGDPRSYALSAYSYFMVPTQETPVFKNAHGASLGFFTQYALCEGQQTMGTLGYSPLPMNLVLAAMEQIRKVPGVDADTIAKLDAVKNSTLGADGGNPCNNPTFKPGDSPSHNNLVDTAPFPAGCDAACQAPWKLAGAGVNAGPDFGAGTGAPATGGGAGGAGTGGAGTGGAAPGTTDPNAVGAASTEVCDPDTGVCTSDSELTAGGVGAVKSVPVVLATQNGWAGQQTLMALALIGLAAVLVTPPLTSQFLRRRR